MLDDQWAKYAQLQGALARTSDKTKAAGLEAAMTDLLEKIAAGQFASQNQITNLVLNRRKREHRRQSLLEKHLATVQGQIAINGAETRIQLGECKAICGPLDFRMLMANAQGERYGDIASVFGLSEGAVKIRMHRARKKLLRTAA